MRKEEKVFQTETKELLNLMIHSIYTNKEIFLRELISNASDAIDKAKFASLTDVNVLKEDKDFKIKLSIDEENKTLTISDNGIGMTYEEVLENIGTIAKSGSKAFREKLEEGSDIDIIGQFGVGFYSGFMVADKITLITKSPLSNLGVKWVSSGDGSYEIEEIEKENRGTDIILHIIDKPEYMEFLQEWKIKELIKKYSDYVRYPIYLKDEIINSTKPIWKVDKSKLTDSDYNEFYKSNFRDFEDPMFHFNIKVQGNIEYSALLFIPQKTPFDFYTKDYEKGLELYTKNVFIMDKCSDLIPEYFNFVKGVVDCDNLSLNISREILQQNSELSAIAKNIEKKLISELEKILKTDRDKYIAFWQNFGANIKFGIQDMFGMNKDKLKNLLIFRSTNGGWTTLAEYVERMGDNKEILYVTGDNVENMQELPRVKALVEKGREVLLFVDKIDEFAIKILQNYDEHKFQSINDSNFKFDESEEKKEEIKKLSEDNSDILTKIKETLKDKIVDVELSYGLGDSACSVLARGEISLEMERVLNAMPNGQKVSAQKVLALNPDNKLFKMLQDNKDNSEVFNNLLDVMYSEAMLMEGFSVENPVEFIKKVNSLIK